MANPFEMMPSGYSESSANALTLHSLNLAEDMKKQLLADPMLSALSEGALSAKEKMLGMDFLGAGKAYGQRQADIQSRGVSSALAGRGGGGIGSALAAGAQGRVGAGLQGLTTGMQMQKGYGDILTQGQNVLAQALMGKYNLLTQIFSKQMGVQAPYVGYQGQMGSAGVGALGGMWESILPGMANALASAGAAIL